MDETIYVLVVDPDADRRQDVVDYLSKHMRLVVQDAGTAKAARAVLDDEEIDVVVSEHELPDGMERDVFRYARGDRSEMGRIVFTAADRETVDLNPFHFDLSPWNTTYSFGYINRNDDDALQQLTDLIVDGYQNNVFAPYPVPADERSRREAIDSIPDTAYVLLDDVTALAAELFDVPMASIRLIERDRQRYISCHGFDADELAREKTICTYTIMDDDVLVVEDVQDDPRFADTPFFEELDINWYAGAVIHIDDEPVGTLCLEDCYQHDFGEKKRIQLQALADHASTLITIARERAAADSDRTSSQR